MENEESIDLGRLMQIMLERKKVVGGIIAGCTIVAMGAALMMPKQYESTTLVQTRSAGKDIGGAAAMAAVKARERTFLIRQLFRQPNFFIIKLSSSDAKQTGAPARRLHRSVSILSNL